MKLQMNISDVYVRIVNNVRGKVIWHSTAVAKTVLRISIYRHVQTVCSINVINGPVILLVSIHTYVDNTTSLLEGTEFLIVDSDSLQWIKNYLFVLGQHTYCTYSTQ